MSTSTQIIALVCTVGLLGVIVELVRRRRLLERYALLWLLSTFVLLALETWQGLLNTIGRLMGVVYPVTALFVIALGFVLVLLIHFSLVISQLAKQNKLLAQRIGLLQQELHDQGSP